MHPRIIKPIALYSVLALAIAGCGGGSSGSGSPDPDPITPANNVPVAQDDSVSVLDRATEVTVDVLTNDSDADNDQLSVSEVSQSAQGVIPSIVNGVIVYTLPTGFTGDDTFTYTVSDGEDETTATVTISIAPGLTIEGALGESGLGDGELEFRLGSTTQSANLSGENFSVDIPKPAAGDLIVVTATFSAVAGEKPIILKSYIGAGEQLAAAAVNGVVSEAELPMLYLSAASTSAAALIERAAQAEVATVDQLIEASQVLPQDLLLEGAIALKSIIAGDNPAEYTQQDSYALLQSFPAPVEVAEALKASDSAKYESYRSAVLADAKQSAPIALDGERELLFIEGPSWILRPYGFALQLSESSPGEAYLADNRLHKADDNKKAYTATDRVINLDLSGLFAAETNTVDNQAACQAGTNGIYQSVPVAREIVRYLDTPVFSAYSVVDTHECQIGGGLFDTAARYFQINEQSFGDFTPFTTGKFALSTYRDVDGSVYRDEPRWHAVINSPNGAGGITQRFELKNGYSDTGTVSVLDNGRLVIASQRGDTVEYVALGTEDAALKTFAILRRADGSIASVGGDMITPVTDGIAEPVPGKLLYSDPIFSIVNPASAYHDPSYGFDFGSDNRGNDLERISDTFSENPYGFSWSEQAGHLDLRYFYDRDSSTYQNSCAPAAANCEEYRMREFEVLYQHNGDFYIRVYNETDYSSLYGVSLSPGILQYSYIDRFTPAP